jgi:hypothetical protein
MLPALEQEGEADLAARTARLVIARPDEEWRQWMQQKYRWLRRFFPEEDEEEDFDWETFWSPTAAVRGLRGQYTEIRRRVSGAEIDPYWMLDALAGADERTSRLDEEFVRGFVTTRYALRADLKAALAAAGGPFELPPHGGVERPTIVGEVWVDADGLVRYIVWRQPLRSRKRLRGRSDPPIKMWHSLELWDFGIEVEIRVPEARER